MKAISHPALAQKEKRLPGTKFLAAIGLHYNGCRYMDRAEVDFVEARLLIREDKEGMIGLYAMIPPGQCQFSVREKLRMVPAIFLRNSLAAPLRVLNLVGEWSRRDPGEAHWHFGPFAVDRHLQGQGIGSVLLGTFCVRMDGQKAVAYLETDKLENVRFYEKFGFVTTSEAVVLGTLNWFMRRQPRSG